MSRLTDFKLLSFDVYGTLIDWELGAYNAFKPTLEKSGKPDMDPRHIFEVLQSVQVPEQKRNPGQIYSKQLTKIHAPLCKELDLQTPTEEESKKFGDSVPDWPAFEDTVEALKRLKKVYKMVVLSNVDNTSFAGCNSSSNGLQGFEWDLVLTAEDIGSYKPDHKNFEYMLKKVHEEFGIEKGQVLQTAQSQFHDHHPAKEMGIKSSWIYRPNQIKGNRQDPVYNWKFDTLAEMADAVEKELAEGR